MTTDDEPATTEESASEPGTFTINGEEFTAKEFTAITTRTGESCDVDFCQHCGLAYNPAEQGWFVDRNDIGPDADGETARLFREDALQGRYETEWTGFTEDDIGAWCDSCSWIIQRKRTQRVALTDGGEPMTETETQTDDSTDDEIDQYDTILRAMEEGLLISINNEAGNSLECIPTGELRVEWSYDDKTNVHLSGFGDTNYQIHRDRRGDLIYSEVTEDGLSYEGKVISIEVIGLD